MSNCTIIPINTTNLCDISLGERPNDPMPGFCTNPRFFLQYGTTFCAAMSTGGEFANPSRPSTDFPDCPYDSCIQYQEVTQDFNCNGCVPLFDGQSLLCQRVSFTGDPSTCCLNDLACTGIPSNNPPACYSDPARQHACSDGIPAVGSQVPVPNYRSITSIDCQDVLIQYCTGTLPTDNPSSVEWLNRWTVGGPRSCSNALARNIFRTGNTGPCIVVPPVPGICNIHPVQTVNAEGYFWAQNVMDLAIARYTQQGFEIGTLPGLPGYNPWQDYIYNTVCCPYPGVCAPALTTVCETKTAQRISLNPTLAQWCGCYLPEPEYQAYSVKFNIPPACTPMCNRVGTIPVVGINGEAVNCDQSVCLIDDVTVNIINSTIGGGIDFNQICSNCPGATCSCVVSNTTIDIANSTIGGNLVPIGQGCGSFTCNQTNPGNTGPTNIAVPCGQTLNPYAEYEAEVAVAQQEAVKTSWLWTVLAIGIGLVLIFFIIFFITPAVTSAVKPVMTTPLPITLPAATATVNPVPITLPAATSVTPVATNPVAITLPVPSSPVALSPVPITPNTSSVARILTPQNRKFMESSENYNSILNR